MKGLSAHSLVQVRTLQHDMLKHEFEHTDAHTRTHEQAHAYTCTHTDTARSHIYIDTYVA